MGLVEDKVKRYLENIKKKNGKINAILHVNENALSDAKKVDAKKKKGRLYGYVFAIKSNINTKGLIANCASKTLENYVSPYDATVIEKIKGEDAVIIGMANQDEFACGWSGETSAYGATDNPAAPGKVAGGSSSGSAAAVAADFCDVALGSDTGGSIRNPASNCGIVGVKPSYGFVSRHGLIDLSMSLDQIGPLAKNVSDAALVLDVIRGKDDNDETSFDSDKVEIKDIKKLKVGILRIKGVDKKIEKLFDDKVEEIKNKYKWDVKEIKIEHIDLAVQTYYPLLFVEFYSGTRRFDGRKYGFKIEDVCGEEVLRRILGGSEVTKSEFKGTYYRKAVAVKELIKKEFDKVFESYDCVLLPTMPLLPWNLGEGKNIEIEKIYATDALTIPANLAGTCAVSIPMGKINDIPTGLQVMCARGAEGKMLSIAKKIEDL